MTSSSATSIFSYMKAADFDLSNHRASNLASSNRNDTSTVSISSSFIVYTLSILLVAIVVMVIVRIHISNNKGGEGKQKGRSSMNNDVLGSSPFAYRDNSTSGDDSDGGDDIYDDDDNDNDNDNSASINQPAQGKYDPENCFADVCFGDEEEEHIVIDDESPSSSYWL
jgi:hypothetical protein